ncbi:MAG: hypothetical protein IIW48_07375 [Clostridia bacterium]|nr:hypothetical protein [Clostridia bacterium]
MQYPSLKNNPLLSLKIPAFNGGINTSATPQDIQDNQAVSISNMWFKDGTAQTRPSLKRGSINACFIADGELIDLDIEIKLGYESYSDGDVSQGNSKQHTYRLFLTPDRQFLLYDVHLNSFSTVTAEFQKPLYQECLNEGELTSHFFYTKGLGDSQLETDSGYIQAFHTEVYGFMMLENCAAISGKDIMLLGYFSPMLDGENVKVKVEIFNFTKDLPEEHQPYYPTVTLDYGTSYGMTLEDFNLLADKSIATYNVNKSLKDMQIIETKREYVNKGFVKHSAMLNWGQYKKGDFGNFNSFEKVSFALPGLAAEYFDEAIIYGEFNFYSYKTKKWSLPLLGLRLAAGTYADTSFEGGDGTYDGNDEPITYKEAEANRLIIKRNKNNGEVTCIFYDENDRKVNPEKMTLGGSNRIRCSGNPTASITKESLDIWLPSTTCDVVMPYKEPQDEGYLEYIYVGRPMTFHTADINIEHMDVTYYHNSSHGETEYWDEQNRAEFVTRNTLKIWYGGTNSGYTGGTRLFAAGHPEFKNVLRWSNVNDSSYFLENNFAYIGRDDELITALNKQDGYLVVFKEHELYALEYTYTTDTKNNALVYFPVTPISPYIGCDCPDTIQLIANRLTWLTSEGKVYTLYSENSYNERNVRELSNHIENDLKKHSREDLLNAKSIDYESNYFIFVGNTAYIWNYDANPFYNYTSSEQAQKRLCWFKWDFPYPVEYAYNVNGQLVVICKDNDGDSVRYQGYVLDYNSTTDEGIDTDDDITVSTEYKSKLFNFGKPFSFKKIDRAFFEIETPTNGDFQIYFYTDNGEVDNPANLTSIYSNINSNVFPVRPYLRRVRSAGFTIKSETPIKLISAEMSAEIYGEVK